MAFSAKAFGHANWMAGALFRRPNVSGLARHALHLAPRLDRSGRGLSMEPNVARVEWCTPPGAPWIVGKSWAPTTPLRMSC